MKLETNEILILQWGKLKKAVIIDPVNIIKAHTTLSKAEIKRLIRDGSVKIYHRFK